MSKIPEKVNIAAPAPVRLDEMTALKVENLLLQQDVLHGKIEVLKSQANGLLETAARDLKVSLEDSQYDVSQRAFVPRPASAAPLG